MHMHIDIWGKRRGEGGAPHTVTHSTEIMKVWVAYKLDRMLKSRRCLVTMWRIDREKRSDESFLNSPALAVYHGPLPDVREGQV